jgi:CRISPR-associated protein Cmr2
VVSKSQGAKILLFALKLFPFSGLACILDLPETSTQERPPMTSETVYTAISFAPVQGFIEKSRKLRDLYGASLILSYLSSKLIETAQRANCEIISPGALSVKKGMPNRILLKGYLDRNVAQNDLIQHWQTVLRTCRQWVEKQVPVPSGYHWSQTEEQVGKSRGEWERWGHFTWELFWGVGTDPQSAMEDLENRKLKRAWVGVNWTGESSSLSGTDAIAWPGLGALNTHPGRTLAEEKQQELNTFYTQLATALETGTSDSDQPEGKFLDPSERLSIPELVKRLVTRYDGIGNKLDRSFKVEHFSEIIRKPTDQNPGHWTGWFMGDGDKVGDHLKHLARSGGDTALRSFSEAMRDWGQRFERNFPKDVGRVVYAGGDDFLGILYSSNPQKPLPVQRAMDWLLTVNNEWKTHKQAINLSLGFVWAGHSVPQRDVLQHCREAEKRSKSLGRDRVTIRVLFNSGQYVQWTCPWAHLRILDRYQDRVGGKNWAHLYNDWAHLRSRHAIRLREVDKEKNPIDRDLGLAMLDLYFDGLGKEIQNAKEKKDQWKAIVGDNSDVAIVQWINDLVQVGWQLCSNI